jgi:hypothetical protein
VFKISLGILLKRRLIYEKMYQKNNLFTVGWNMLCKYADRMQQQADSREADVRSDGKSGGGNVSFQFFEYGH